MKRLITFICLILVIYCGIFMINKGVKAGSFEVASYKEIEEKSKGLTKKLANYDKKNTEEYDSAVSSLNSTIKMYNDSKEKYEQISKELEDVLKNNNTTSNETTPTEQVIYSDKEKYKIPFLLVRLGNYGEKEGVDVDFKLSTSSTTDPNSANFQYFLGNLEFTVTGQYMNVSQYITDLENDDELGWEISNFEMSEGTAGSGVSGVQAKFVIKDVPIDSESYIESSNNTGTDANNQNQQTGGENGQGTVDPNAVATDNTTVNGSTDVNTVTNTISSPATNTNMNTVANTTSGVTSYTAGGNTIQ